MRRPPPLVGLAALGVLLAIAASVWFDHGTAPEQSAAVPGPQVSAVRVEPVVPVDTSIAAGPPPATEQPVVDGPALMDPPAADRRLQVFEERMRFHERVRTFFAQTPALSAREKRERAQELAQELTRYEAAREITAAEALLLRTALLRESVADPATQAAEITALRERYREESERKLAEWQQRYDPELEAYKAREQEIVAEVMVMTELPDGLTRDEYLRRRLQRAREQTYGQ
jgi:hypothetical protein